MKDLKLVIRETKDKTLGMEDAVHIDFDNGEPCQPYVERELAEEMVRRWNTQPDLLATLEAIHDGLASCETKDELLNTVGMCIVQARAAIQKATQP